MLTRLVALFLLWTGVRSVWFVTLADADPNFRLAMELGFGPLVRTGQILYGLAAVTAAAAVWWRWRKALTLATIAFALYAATTLFQLQQTRANPEAAKQAYAASREARGLPVPQDRLDAAFSESGQRFMWGIGLAMCIVPYGVLLWRRRDLEA